ncbi:fibronectin type III domain-containing protein [Spirosoma foliorum]|uniref:Fibronectin type III domain-containing protein n=1 Tax=Spirosoma foliorum TaxID=2710596 RepID=A0A7G5GWJ9_9BACT|nr:fibronectin type III domain-containing protein [Spirosoma foliorum]QMW03241.1 fibronectin type III domain-containing protein [Spirosoma foliorum]
MNIRYLIFLLISYTLSCTFVYADCQAPQYAYTYSITHQSADLSWFYFGSSSPIYQIQWRISGSTTWTTNPPVQTTTYTTLTGLANNTAYEWHVRSICAAGDTSVYGNVSTFQTKCDPPSNPAIANVTHQSAQLNWYTTLSGFTYEIQWRPTGATTWTVIGGLAGNSFTLSGLTDETPYEWKVRTTCSAAATSDFVTGPIFQTHCKPPTNPRLTLTNPDAVELKWDSPQTNAHFDLQWRLTGASDWILVEGISLSEYVLTSLTNGATYEWRVRTACSATSKSAFTDIQQFQTSCPLPSFLSSGSVTNNSAVLQWRASASELQWRSSGTTTWNTVSLAKSPYSLTGLTNNKTYEWRVRTVCSASAMSDYSPLQLVSTQCLAPTGARSSPNATGGLELSWDSTDGGPFEVQWRTTGATNWSSVAGISYTGYTLTGLTPAAVYEWRVRKVCSPTDYSDFATAQPVQTSCNAPTYTQSANATSTTIDLSWNAGETSAQYELQWRVTNTTNWTTVSGITSTGYSLTGLQANVSYEWRVRKLCSDQVASAFTANQTFTLTCSSPTYFYTNSIGISSAVIGWGGSSTYPPYEVQYRVVGAADWTLLSDLATPYYALKGLSNNTTYEWRVRSGCSIGGAADFSGIQTFHTQCGASLSGLAVGDIDISSVKLTWDNATSFSLYEIQYRDIAGGDWVGLRPEGTETDRNFGIFPFMMPKEYRLYGLTFGKTYAWRVRVICSPSVYSDFVDGPTFITACPTPPRIDSYQRTNTSVSVSWEYSTAASGYDVQWRAVGASAWNTVNGVQSSTYLLTNLSPGTVYEYRVQRVCWSGIVSDYSNVATIVVQCITPPIVNKASVVSASSAQLTWRYPAIYESDAAIIVHELQYRIAGTSDWTSVTGIVGTAYSLTGLTTGSSYEWRVRATCSPTVVSDFSATSTFGLVCQATFDYVYTAETSPTTAQLVWSNPALPSSKPYSLRWRIVGTTVWSTLSVATSTYSLTGLTNNTTYEWQVATDCNGYLSDFSTLQSFQTSCPNLGYTSLSASNVGTTSAQLSWSGASQVPGLTYSVQYRISGAVIWSEVNGLTSPSTSLTGLTNNTTYEWRIRANCEFGSTSTVSSINTFATICYSPWNSHPDAATTQSVSTVWRPNPDNVYVNLQWREASASTPWNVVNGLTGYAYSLTGLTPGTTYEYKLQGACSTNDLASPNVFPFMTLPVSSTALSIYTDSSSYQAIRLNWTGPDRTNYILQWRVSGGSWTTTGPLSTKRYLLTGLTTGTIYDIRVSYVGDNAVTYEATLSAKPSCPSILNARVSAVASTSAQLTWTSVDAPVSVQWRVAGTTQWNTIAGVTGGAYSLTGLTNNVIYEWRLQTICSANVTNVTYPSSFRTNCQVPNGMFTLNMTPQSVQLRWEGTSAQYSVQYRVVGVPTWTTVTGVTSTSYTLTGLTANTLYEWSVSASCEGNSTLYAIPVQFIPQCSEPPLIQLINPLAPDRAQLGWYGTDLSYQLQWRVVGATTWTDIPTVTSPYTLTGLTTGTTYEARIRSACAVANNGEFVLIRPFTPQCQDSYYYNDYKSTTNITSGTARLNWQANSLLAYRLRWRIMGTNSWTNVPGSVTSPYTLTGLTNNTSYEWQLHTDCEPMYYAASQVFQTACAMPGGFGAEPLTATSVNLHWTRSGEEVAYELQWRVLGESAWTSVSGITTTNYVLTGLGPTATYEWQVRSQCLGVSPFQLTTSFKLGDDCSLNIYTVRAGSWDDPTVWSCNRIPTLTDQVKLNHALVIPNAYVAKALTIRYETGAKLTFGIGSSIKMGN